MVLALNISGLSGFLGTVVVDATSTLAHAKTAIEKHLYIPVAWQRLIHGLTELRNPKALAQFAQLESIDLSLIRRTEEQAQRIQNIESLDWAQLMGWFAEAPEHVRADREIVLAGMAVTGGALRYAAPELKSDREFILDAMTLARNGNAFGQASPEIRSDREFVLSAVAMNASVLFYVAEELLNDRDFLLAAVAQNGLALEYAPEKFRSDREIVFAAVSCQGLALRFACPEFQADSALRAAARHQWRQQ